MTYRVIDQIASNSVENTLSENEVPDFRGKAGEKDRQSDNREPDSYASSLEGRPPLKGNEDRRGS